MEISGDAHHVATVTQSGTRGMKALAIITMLFVPGAFISSLISTPLFEWQTEGKFGTSKFQVQTTQLLL
jgi:hypothetical protein